MGSRNEIYIYWEMGFHWYCRHQTCVTTHRMVGWKGREFKHKVVTLSGCCGASHSLIASIRVGKFVRPPGKSNNISWLSIVRFLVTVSTDKICLSYHSKITIRCLIAILRTTELKYSWFKGVGKRLQYSASGNKMQCMWESPNSKYQQDVSTVLQSAYSITYLPQCAIACPGPRYS